MRAPQQDALDLVGVEADAAGPKRLVCSSITSMTAAPSGKRSVERTALR
jgi:hypothetical protein